MIRASILEMKSRQEELSQENSSDVTVGATHIEGYEICLGVEGGEKHGLQISEATLST